MENELLAIGRVSALSGLPVSALRFYDGAGVLSPCWVDPSSGYRFYRPAQVRQARLVAHLRRVGLPLDDIRTVVADPALAGPVLAAHLGRLEAGLADARREISIVHDLLENSEISMSRCTLPAADLVRALREIRYAVCDDPDQPRLHGIYLDSEPGRVRLVATDRHRLATSAVATPEPTDLHLLLPTPVVDALLAADVTDTVDVVVSDGTVTVTGVGCTVSAEVPDVDFPSYRVLLEHGRQEVPVDAAALRAELAAGTTTTLTSDDGVGYEVSLLSVGQDGVRVGPTDEPGALTVAVNRDFLLQALEVGDQLTLGLDDPIAPLAIRTPGREGTSSVLMPVRLDQPA
ncbi:MerR family transcriptional regulator [Knoellia sp. LjRoot47]|uniref:DNA polymerase III subunit beta family protein n=1 Tax=Knoellia sp. LjRoot47 TaxID=3342330 RepID=UPI003ECD171D